MNHIGQGDFAYLDPPYPPLNGTAYFTHYTVDRFCQRDQEDLAEIAREMDQRGARFLMSNADTPLIRRLYSSFRIEKLSVTRFITCKAKRHQVSELVIMNYEQPPEGGRE
jgi:DNA adenine methylase